MNSERLENLGLDADGLESWERVKKHFDGDAVKANRWFLMPNSMLENISPIDMVDDGRSKKLLTFVRQQIEDAT